MAPEPIPFIILSYPRSGNHWVRYVVEWFTGRPTLGADFGEHWRDPGLSYRDTPIYCRAKLPHVGGYPVAKKRHKLTEWDDRGAALICIVRDYKESVARHIMWRDRVGVERPPRSDQDLLGPEAKGELDAWAQCLRQYDGWPSRKLLVRYEDLIDEPGQGIRSISEFLGVCDPERENDFVSNLAYHRHNALGSLISTSATEGGATSFHRLALGDELAAAWDQYMERNHSDVASYVAPYLEDH